MAIDIVTTIGTYVMGAVLREIQERNNESFRERQFAGLTEEEMQQVIAEFADRARATGRYPRLVALMDDDHDPDAPQTRDARFEFGLNCLLDGIAAPAARPAGNAAGRPSPAGAWGRPPGVAAAAQPSSCGTRSGARASWPPAASSAARDAPTPDRASSSDG